MHTHQAYILEGLLQWQAQQYRVLNLREIFLLSSDHYFLHGNKM